MRLFVYSKKIKNWHYSITKIIDSCSYILSINLCLYFPIYLSIYMCIYFLLHITWLCFTVFHHLPIFFLSPPLYFFPARFQPPTLPGPLPPPLAGNQGHSEDGLCHQANISTSHHRQGMACEVWRIDNTLRFFFHDRFSYGFKSFLPGRRKGLRCTSNIMLIRNANIMDERNIYIWCCK